MGQVDLAFDHMPKVSSFAGQDHFDLEFSLSSKPLLTHHPFDSLLRGDQRSELRAAAEEIPR